MTQCPAGNTSDYLAYPVGFTVCRLAFAFQNTFNPPNQIKALDSTQRMSIAFCVLGCFVLTLVAYVGPMNRISKLVYKIQRLEGNFHTTHARTIQHSESVCLYGGEARELGHAESQFAKLQRTLTGYYHVQVRPLSLCAHPPALPLLP